LSLAGHNHLNSIFGTSISTPDSPAAGSKFARGVAPRAAVRRGAARRGAVRRGAVRASAGRIVVVLAFVYVKLILLAEYGRGALGMRRGARRGRRCAVRKLS